MKFCIENKSVGAQEALVLCNKETGESLEVLPTLGGTIGQGTLLFRDGLRTIFAVDSTDELEQNPLFRGRFLFPFNDRIPGGVFRFGERQYSLPANLEDGSAIHGFVHDRLASVSEQGCSNEVAFVTLNHRICAGEVPGYPFDVALNVRVTLMPAGCELSFEMINEGKVDAPVALGWHPYFALFESSALEADFSGMVEVDEELVPTRRILPVSGTEFDFSKKRSLDHRALDMGFLARNRTVRLYPGPLLIRQTGDFKYTQLYLPDDRQSLAIEPITGATNSFNFPELGRLVLAPGQRRRAAVSISTDCGQPVN